MIRLALVAALLAAGCGRDPRAESDSVAPTGWFLAGSASARFRAALDREVVHGGSASARLEAIGAAPDGTLMQVIDAAPYRGKRLQLSGFVRTAEVSGWAGLWMRVDRAVGRSAFDNMQDRPRRGTTAWTRCAVVLDVAADATAIQLGLFQDGSGTSWLDDAALEIVGDRVASTDLDARPRALENGDFEAGDAATGWLLVGPGKDDAAVEIDRTDAAQGARSVRIRSRVDRPRGQAVLVQDLRADDYRGQRVQLTAAVKAADAEWVELFAAVQTANAGAQSQGIAGGHCDLPTSGTFGWRRCAFAFDVPGIADTIEIGGNLEGRGTLWLDDVRLAVVDRSVAVAPRTAHPALVNGDFEADGAAPTGWFISGGGRSHYGAAIDRSVVRSGRAAVRLEPRVPVPLGYGTLMQQIDADDYRGQRLRLTAAIRTRDATADLWARVQTGDSPADGGGISSAGTAITGTTDWTTYELVFDVPPGGAVIQLGAGLRARGTLWLDDVELAPVGREVPLTPSTVRPTALANGDFEAGQGEPSGWLVAGGAASEYEAAIDRAQFASGAASGRLRARVAAPGGYGTLMQSIAAAGYRGQRLRLRAQVRGEGITGRGDLWLRVQAAYSPADGPGLGGGGAALAGSSGWQTHEIVFDVPEAADAIQLGVGLAGPGTIWLDDVRLEPAPPGTAASVAVRAAGGPVNLDFEASTHGDPPK